MLLEGAGYIFLGFNSYVDHKPNYIGLAITARIITGFGGTCISTTIYAIVLNFYVVNQDRALLFAEIALEIGVLIGPGIGTLLFVIGGYNFMIYFYGGSMILFAISFQFLLPAFLDMHTDSEERGDEREEEEDQISKMELVMHPNYFFALFVIGFGCIA
jgi:MFS family permease